MCAVGTGPSPPGQRRTRRRAETIEEILRLAIAIMAENGASGLTFAELARRLGVRPPSLYKYFPSVHAVYDELFRRGQSEHLEAVKIEMDGAPPGMASLSAGLQAGSRWAADNPVLAQLLFWRPVPGFNPSPEAFAPSVEMVNLFRLALRDAVAAREVGRAAASDQLLDFVSVVAAGTGSQYLANEPGVDWAHSRFLGLIPLAVEIIRAAYAPSESMS